MLRRNAAGSLSLVMVFAGGAIGLAAADARGQCDSGWVAGTANSDMDGLIRCLSMWDPDGAGGQPPVLVAGGDFLNAGTAAASRIAAWDGANWSPLGLGTNAGVYWLTPHEDGLVVCGPSLTEAGGNTISKVAKWTPLTATWSDQGNFTNTGVTPLTVASGGPGKLYMTGAFTSVGGVSGINRVGRYDGVVWSALDVGTSSTTSSSIVLPNGDLVVGGAFLDAGGISGVNRIARWDGTQWHALGTGTSGLVRCLLVMSNGDLIAGGLFATAGDQPVGNIARWDGTSWHEIGGGTNLDVFALAEMPNGDLVAAGAFGLAGATAVNNIARWNGTTWSAMGSGVDVAGMPTVIRSIAVLPSGELAIGGDFTTAGGQSALRFARWVDGGPAVITTEPESQNVCPEETVVFSLEASGGAPLAYQWEIQDIINLPDFIPLVEGENFDPFFNYIFTASGTDTAEVTLSSVTPAASGVLRCVVSNACNQDISSEITMLVTCGPTFCDADWCQDGEVGVPDIFCFLTAWFALDPEARNYGGSEGVPAIFAFLSEWFSTGQGPCTP